MKTRAPRRHPLAIACSQAHGFSLLEASLALAAAAAIGTAAFLVFRPSSTVAAVRVEQANLRDLSQAVETSFGLVGGFNGVTTARASADGLVPSAMTRSGSILTTWGGAVEISAAQAVQPNDAFAIAYPAVPSEACVSLAGAVADSVWDLRVGGHSVFTAGSLDPAALASRCSTDGGANMIFVYHSGLATGTAVAATPVTNPPPVVAPPTAPPSPPGTTVAPPVAPPVVVAPPVIVAPPGVTPPPVVVTPPPVVVTPPVVVAPADFCTLNPTAPACMAVAPPYTQTCQAQLPGPETQTRAGTVQGQVLDCAASNYGQVNQARTPSEARTRSWFCPDENGNPSNEPWGDPTATLWTSWAVTSNGTWATTANTCAPCPGPSTETGTQWAPASGACPSGETGTVTWEKAQARTRTLSTVCPAGTRTLPAVTVGAWSGWSDTGATRNVVNSCAPATCSGPSTDTRLDPRTGACPAGQTGATSWNAEQTTSRTCNAGTWSGWGAWSDTGATSGYASTCTPTAAPCVAPAPETTTRWTPTSAACPSGQSGTHTWEFAESHTRTAFCPAATGPFSWNAWGAWSATGATRNDVNTCAPTAPPCVSPDYSLFVSVKIIGSVTSARTESSTNAELVMDKPSGSCAGNGSLSFDASATVTYNGETKTITVTQATTTFNVGGGTFTASAAADCGQDPGDPRGYATAYGWVAMQSKAPQCPAP